MPAIAVIRMKRSADSPSTGGDEFAQKCNLYREYLAEREEILRHKWLESEKAGYDIGWDRALYDWMRNHRHTWRAKRRSELTREDSSSSASKEASPPTS